MLERILDFLQTTGIATLFSSSDWWQTLIMFAISFILVYLAIVKKFEPLLLLPIAIGMFLTNLPGANMFNLNFFIPPEESVTTLTALVKECTADMQLTFEEYQRLMGAGLNVSDMFPQLAAGAANSVALDADMSKEMLDMVTAVDFGEVLHKGGLLDLPYIYRYRRNDGFLTAYLESQEPSYRRGRTAWRVRGIFGRIGYRIVHSSGGCGYRYYRRS